MNRRQLIATSAAALVTAAAAPSDLRGDVEIVRRALALHPGLHRYSTPAEMAERLAAFEPAFVAAGSLEARYLVLSRLLATIRCGHSYCNFSNQRKAAALDLFDRKTRLPFHFTWLGTRMVATGDPSHVGVPVGAEIVTINGAPASDLLAALRPFARADGHNEAKRVALLGVGGADRVEYFDVFHGLVFGPPAGGTHKVWLRTPSGEDRRLEMAPLGLAERQAQMTRRDERGAEPSWDWSVRPDGVAVLTMPSWAMFNSRWNWRAWLDDRLDSLSDRQGLILDLRGNEGGEDCGDAILARLTPRRIVSPRAARLVRFQRTPADLDPFLDTWDNAFRTLGVGAAPVSDGFYRLSGALADDSVAPRGRRLIVRTAALIGPANSSATFGFAQMARASGLVRLFGQPTGGNRRGINGGCFFFVRLPASGIEFDLPLIGYFPPGHPPDAGLTPDIIVEPSVADIASGYDRSLETAARWVSG